ncbi:DUF1249 domain-containing protein [Kistimonas asteriae]|uniref:DUF1249 domain-containing protein n=1 Tax=Kistimonas asteriae TaxID=517724 RepID=UPI001BA8AF41|nr:DUF1249 domain-containing protein [Kistimonas asteriae]
MTTIGQLPHHRKPYQVNLVRQHVLCEMNYIRLMKLIAGNASDEWMIGFSFHGQTCSVHFQITSRSRYTTVIDITQDNRFNWLPCQKMQVRLYHDVRMAEVISSQRQRDFKPRYNYPNTSMYHPDEKEQLNLFLADWLEHCLNNGYLFETIEQSS